MSAAWNSHAPNLPQRSQRSLELLHLPYFHPNLKSMDDVRKLLLPYLSENGHFIVRNSFSKPDTITVSVMHERSIKHFNIGRNADGFYLQDRLFPTLDSLIKNHAKEDVPNIEGVQHVRLLTPVATDNIGPGSPPRRGSDSMLPDVHSVNSSFGSYPNLRRQPIEHTESGSSGGSVASRLSDRGRSMDINSNIEGQDSNSPKSSNATASSWKNPLNKIFRKVVSKDSITPPSSSHPKIGNISSNQRLSADAALAQRPPVPIPREERSVSESGFDLYAAGIYSRVENQTDKAPLLAEALRKHDPTTKCECGLELEDSVLPRSWSVHISREATTMGKIFFEGPQGQTCWNLPLDVSTELSFDQQEFIRKLLHDVRAGKLPPPAPHGEASSADTSARKSVGAFNNSAGSSADSGGMVARGISPSGSVRSSLQRNYSGGADAGASADGRESQGAISAGEQSQ